MSKKPLPWDFHPQLTEERLTIIAKELLQVLNDTYAQLSTTLDNNYTRSTCTFGRQWQLLIDLCLSGQYSWLHLTNAGLDIRFTIDRIPVRVFTDDPDNPKKDGFYRRNPADQLFAPEVNIPVLHRFVVEKPEFEGEGAKVHFIGYNALDEEVSKWTYNDEPTMALLHSTDDTPPESVRIELDDIRPSRPEKEEKESDRD